ncbi:uncharacterized protein LOC108622920 [Ceratina calcarata]|uniref:Uncharacterized protein LOC108622920 n=1 Tax=Ceratina calcarata TaxID=156304 RepID=A0AAJ7ITV2_9HYME|nr:uncharacterized protein LOC108622920 [Ceratina calcarata]XP_017876549.1 uncharacterized protein LOC108622920 [Ceratina calcarata]XP_026667709.1 uncharacterized protein LOC108622920 [Ceratina calcarata]
MESRYKCLLEDFLSVGQLYINQNMLYTLKERYRQCIDSDRKFSQIKDLRTLLKILEKRDTLSCDNIEPLFYISNHFVNDLQMIIKIRQYKDNFEKTEYFPSYNMNQNLNENKNYESQLPVKKSNPSEGKYCEKDVALQDILLSRVSERIGRSWRDTVRYLGVPEYQIDAIHSKYAFDLREQSYQALKLYMAQYSDNNWKLDLIKALDKARRRDLKELVERLIIELDK